jgi:peptidyl-prolyl cis-trans isomerase SurA
MLVQQTKARHILIKTSPVVTDEMAQQRMKEIQTRVIEGKEPFSDLAKRFSNDSSAPQGGDLGWLNPGETVPPFDRAMNELKIGEVSQPVKTQFGWHLIVVDDRRTQDMAEQFQRNQVRQFLFQKRSEAAFEEWIAQVRNQSYVDNRLEKRLKQATE